MTRRKLQNDVVCHFTLGFLLRTRALPHANDCSTRRNSPSSAKRRNGLELNQQVVEEIVVRIQCDVTRKAHSSEQTNNGGMKDFSVSATYVCLWPASGPLNWVPHFRWTVTNTRPGRVTPAAPSYPRNRATNEMCALKNVAQKTIPTKIANLQQRSQPSAHSALKSVATAVSSRCVCPGRTFWRFPGTSPSEKHKVVTSAEPSSQCACMLHRREKGWCEDLRREEDELRRWDTSASNPSSICEPWDLCFPERQGSACAETKKQKKFRFRAERRHNAKVLLTQPIQGCLSMTLFCSTVLDFGVKQQQFVFLNFQVEKHFLWLLCRSSVCWKTTATKQKLDRSVRRLETRRESTSLVSLREMEINLTKFLIWGESLPLARMHTALWTQEVLRFLENQRAKNSNDILYALIVPIPNPFAVWLHLIRANPRLICFLWLEQVLTGSRLHSRYDLW